MKEVDHDMIWDRTSEQCIMSPVHDIPQHQNLLSFAIAKKEANHTPWHASCPLHNRTFSARATYHVYLNNCTGRRPFLREQMVIIQG